VLVDVGNELDLGDNLNSTGHGKELSGSARLRRDHPCRAVRVTPADDGELLADL
jgi:hypothetical protein